MPEKQKHTPTKDKNEIIIKMASKQFIRWMFGLMATVLLIPLLVIGLDLYWFITLFSKKLSKIGLIKGIILAGLNILILIAVIIFFTVTYCTLNLLDCGW